eukprot:CAMPEP_0113829316 /NCGR_PEP_ID=MMETSP0328-20130328/5734_1 /TAXON_ID=39455 /ORGANISM="Alexandrium minutum" /LENGTH=167 /DNA_ID=CAMNT_0000797361 /DNA_START=282 /DNA_END=786 /DNA_ORIENTATION=+ /assembly_acc=CAM_ASM_000350
MQRQLFPNVVTASVVRAAMLELGVKALAGSQYMLSVESTERVHLALEDDCGECTSVPLHRRKLRPTLGAYAVRLRAAQEVPAIAGATEHVDPAAHPGGSARSTRDQHRWQARLPDTCQHIKTVDISKCSFTSQAPEEVELPFLNSGSRAHPRGWHGCQGVPVARVDV